MNFDTENLLKFALEQGIIKLDNVRDAMKEQERKRLLSKHNYKIFQDKDGRWKTTLPDSTKKSGRRLIAKTSRESLDEAIVQYYSIEEKKDGAYTLRKLYPEWKTIKFNHTAAPSSIKRIQNDWDKFYETNEISDFPLDTLTFLQLDDWAHKMVRKYTMTKKQYFNMSLIIRQCLDYACEIELIKENLYRRVKINSKLFAQSAKPANETQVFLENEQIELRKLVLERHKKDPRAVPPLAILLNFQLGTRVGELVALKWSDISEDNYITIQRSEIKDFKMDEEGNIKGNGVKVVEFTKTEAGRREIYLNSEARYILGLIKERNEQLNLYDDDYIMVSSISKRITIYRINDYLYQLCDHLNIGKKSSHKIRKTFVSSLFDNGVNINRIREIAGHEDERTSLNNYCFDRRADSVTEKLLDDMGNRVMNNAI